MKNNYGLDDEFVRILHEFRENRNEFVHQIWDLADSCLSTKEGRQQALSFIVALYAIASALNKLLIRTLSSGSVQQVIPLRTWGLNYFPSFETHDSITPRST
jgi:hypothetical protein